MPKTSELDEPQHYANRSIDVRTLRIPSASFQHRRAVDARAGLGVRHSSLALAAAGTHTLPTPPDSPTCGQRPDAGTTTNSVRTRTAIPPIARSRMRCRTSFGRAGRLEWVNDRWFELTGLREEQTLHDNGMLDGVHPEDRDELAQHWVRAVETSASVEIEYRLRNKLSDYRWHLGRMFPVRNPNGNVVRWLGVAIDIHDRRAAEDALRVSERRFETVFDLSPQPLAITREADGRYLYVNDAFVELMGFTREEAVGKTSVELGLWTLEQRAEFVGPLKDSPRRSLEITVRAKDGRAIRVVLSSIRSEIDGVPCMVNSSTDVTDERANEDALRQVDRRKDEFLAMLSHELRNPLTPILTAARLLERRVDDDARQDVGIIIRQVKHLVRLVDDLLDISRVAKGTVTLSKTQLDLHSVVSRAVEATSPLFEERGHHLDISMPATGLEVVGDAVRLTQIVDNLLSNAARYTPPGGMVTVTGAQEDDSVVLRVRDTGIGIDPSLLPDLFGTFVQGPRGPDRAEGGLGIGLSLVRTLTELHGGTVTARSDGLGQGSEFSIRLPRWGKATGLARPAAPRFDANDSASTSARVLLVDDHSDVVEGLSRLLSVLGYDVRGVRNPLEAIELAEVFRPQIAILDIGLPTMDGYALAQALRSRLNDSPPTLIALTGYGQPRDRERSDASGFAAHLVKPIDVDELVETLIRFRSGSLASNLLTVL
jgi:PAS domain S-box-containing protein